MIAEVQNLHEAYCNAMGIELVMNPSHERMWYEAHRQGMTPEDISLCLAARLKSNRVNNYKFGVMIHHLARGEDEIAAVLNEAAVIRAQRRVKVMDVGKADVLRATHRPTEMPTNDAQKIGDIELIRKLKDAAS